MTSDPQILQDDLYFSERYAQCYLDDNAQQTLFSFRFEEGSHLLQMNALQRKIPDIAGVSVTPLAWDLESAYGYGGLLSTSANPGFLQKAIVDLKDKAKAKGIVAQFMRFHPFHDVQRHCAHLLDMLVCDRKVVVVELTADRESQRTGYSPTARNLLKRADENLRVTISTDIHSFHELYLQTMARLQAPSFYYFSEEYLSRVLSLKEATLLEARMQGNLTGMAIFFFSGPIAYYHLSATVAELRHIPATYAMIDEALELARQRGCKYLLLGGGRSNNPSDTLLSFKRHFSHSTLDYWIGGLIFDRERYHALRKQHALAYPRFETSTFLSYRKVPKRSFPFAAE